MEPSVPSSAHTPGTDDVDALLGAHLLIRPIEPTDAPELIAFHDSLSDTSRYFRFFTAHPTLPAKDAARLADVDGVDRMAFVAHVGDRIYAVGRYDRDGDDPSKAEVAFAVADELQGHGIGTLLLRQLAQHARTHGITRFEAWVLAVNHRMLEVFHDVADEIDCHVDGPTEHVEFDVAAIAAP